MRTHVERVNIAYMNLHFLDICNQTEKVFKIIDEKYKKGKATVADIQFAYNLEIILESYELQIQKNKTAKSK